MTNTTEIAAPATPDRLLELAVQHGADVEKLEKLMDLQERWVAQEARRQYAGAMSAVQSRLPQIRRDALNRQTGSNYATLETISKALVPIYSSHGFSLSFSTDASPIDGWIRVVCDCMHASGHSTQRHLDLPPDTAGIQGKANKTMVHGIGSAISYARRYLTCMAFNVQVNDDDDGNSAGGKESRESIADREGRRLADTVTAIRDAVADYIAAGESSALSPGCEAWCELTEAEKLSLWVAPSKMQAAGFDPIFSTREREVMKSAEFRNAHPEAT